ncbi:MAG: LysR substrate-binding domain-containing protein [Rubrimonas sp.]|uniref:LysR substrate-binding domain-containing protein n=1 Tax=Rubrimonas sp. TaxID=2036015 RepID=UPI002FDCFFCF
MALTSARLRAVNAVACAGAFAAAARRLGVSQPAVAQNVRDLERAYGVRLFDRRGGRLEPTPLCVELCALTERIERLEDEAERMLRRQSALDGGEIRIGLGNSMPGMALIAQFQKAYPSIEAQVELGAHEQIIRAVLTRRVDVGVLPDVPGDGRFARETLIEQEVVAIAHPDHPVAARADVDCAELARHRLIFRRDGSSTQRVVDRAFRAAGLAPRPVLVLDTRDGVCEAVANGLGVGFMWRHGTGRTDMIRHVSVIGMARRYEESAFRLDEPPRPVVQAFLAEIARFRARHTEAARGRGPVAQR